MNNALIAEMPARQLEILRIAASVCAGRATQWGRSELIFAFDYNSPNTIYTRRGLYLALLYTALPTTLVEK